MHLNYKIGLKVSNLILFIFCVFLGLNELKAQKINVLTIEKDNLWGAIDYNGNLLVKPQYNEALFFNKNKLTIAHLNGKEGVINVENKTIVKFNYKELYWLNDSLLAALADSAWGVINLSNRWIIAPKFQEVNIQNEFIWVYTKHHQGIYNIKGKLIIPPVLMKSELLANYFIVENKSLKKGVFSLEGKELHPINADSIKFMNDTVVAVKKDIYWQHHVLGRKTQNKLNFKYINRLNEYLIEFGFSSKSKAIGLLGNTQLLTDTLIYHIDNELEKGFVLAHGKNKVYVISSIGKLLFLTNAERVNYLGENLWSIKEHHKQWQLFANDGQILSNNEWNEMLPFNKLGFGLVRKDSLWGLINKKGKVVLDPIYHVVEFEGNRVKAHFSKTSNLFEINNQNELDQLFSNMHTLHIVNSKEVDNKQNQKNNIELKPVYGSNLKHQIFETVINGVNLKVLDLKEVLNISSYICIDLNKHWGYIDESGRIWNSFKENLKSTVKLHYNFIGKFSNGLATVCLAERAENVQSNQYNLKGWIEKNTEFNKIGKWGVINTKNEIVINPEYDLIKPFNNGIAWAMKNNFWGAINTKGEVVIPFLYNDMNQVANNDSLWIVTENSYTQGIVDSLGSVLVPAIFLDVKVPTEGKSIVRTNLGWQIFDVKKQKILPSVYDEILPFMDSLAPVRLQKKWGFVNHNGELVIKCKYQKVSHFYNGNAYIKNDKGYDVINKKEKKVAFLDAENIKENNYKIIIAEKNKLWGIANHNGTWIVAPKYLQIESFNNFNLAIAHLEHQKLVLLHSLGHHIHEHHFEEIKPFVNGLALVKYGEKWGYIDTLGVYKLHPNYQEAWPFEKGKAFVKIDNQYFVINLKGEKLSEALNLEHVKKASNEFIEVENKSHYLFYNQLGAEEISINKDDWELIASFENEKAILYHKWKHEYQFIDKQGIKLFGKTFEECKPFTNSYASVKKNNFWGMISESGTQLLDFKYDKIENLNSGFIKIISNHKVGLCSNSGRWIFPVIAENIQYIENGIFKVETQNTIKYWHISGKWIW